MKLLTKDLERSAPALGAQDGKGDEAIVHAHFFNPIGAGDWYLTELDPPTGEAFGLAHIIEPELGYFALADLEGLRLAGGLAVERDLYWTPKTIGEVKAQMGRR